MNFRSPKLYWLRIHTNLEERVTLCAVDISTCFTKIHQMYTDAACKYHEIRFSRSLLLFHTICCSNMFPETLNLPITNVATKKPSSSNNAFVISKLRSFTLRVVLLPVCLHSSVTHGDHTMNWLESKHSFGKKLRLQFVHGLHNTMSRATHHHRRHKAILQFIIQISRHVSLLPSGDKWLKLREGYKELFYTLHGSALQRPLSNEKFNVSKETAAVEEARSSLSARSARRGGPLCTQRHRFAHSGPPRRADRGRCFPLCCALTAFTRVVHCVLCINLRYHFRKSSQTVFFRVFLATGRHRDEATSRQHAQPHVVTSRQQVERREAASRHVTSPR